MNTTIQDAAFATDDSYNYNSRYSYENENENENTNQYPQTLRHGGFSQRMRENASYYLEALEKSGDDAKNAIEMFENNIKNLSKASINNPLYGILNTRQNRQVVDPVIKYLAKVADICYMAAKQYDKKLKRCEKIIEVCEAYTEKRTKTIYDAIKVDEAKKTFLNQITTGITHPTITPAQNADVNSSIEGIKRAATEKENFFPYSVSPIALLNMARKNQGNDVLGHLLNQLQ